MRFYSCSNSVNCTTLESHFLAAVTSAGKGAFCDSAESAPFAAISSSAIRASISANLRAVSGAAAMGERSMRHRPCARPVARWGTFGHQHSTVIVEGILIRADFLYYNNRVRYGSGSPSFLFHFLDIELIASNLAPARLRKAGAVCVKRLLP